MLEWFVALVKPRNEQKVQSYLAHYGVEVLSPKMSVLKRGRLDLEPVFPSYVFVRAQQQSREWPIIRWAPGLQYFLPSQEAPKALGDDLVNEIETRVKSWNEGGWTQAFTPGDKVVVEAGPRKSLNAIFQRHLPGEQRCMVLVELMGGPHEIAVEVTDLHTAAITRAFASHRIVRHDPMLQRRSD